MINESRLISAIITNRDIAPAINMQQSDELFETHKDIWLHVKNYYYKYRSIISKDILLEAFNDFQFVETEGPVKHYLDQLREEFVAVKLEKISRGLAKDIGNLPTEILLNAVQRKISEITKVSGTIKDLDITNVEQAMDHYTATKNLMEENGGVLGIRTGFDSIDANYPTGFAPGQMIFIIARTAQKKSWFALDLAVNAWAQNKKVLYVSLEMSPASVRDRAYTLISQGTFGMSDLCRGTLDLEELGQWTKEKFASNKTFVVTSSDGMGDFSTSDLQAKIDQYAPDIVIVDYLQLMTDSKRSSGDTERVRATSRETKSISMTNDIPIIVVASASSNDTKEYNSPPEIYEVANSKQSAFDADLVLSLHTHRHTGGDITEIIARKSRHGPLFNFQAVIDIEKGKVEELWDESLT